MMEKDNFNSIVIVAIITTILLVIVAIYNDFKNLSPSQ